MPTTVTTLCNPLPSLLRASAWDAGNARMRKAGRTVWTRGDYNEAARTQNRLVRACYARKGDPEGSPLPFVRFGVAEQMQREGAFTLTSKMSNVHAAIDHVIAA